MIPKAKGKKSATQQRYDRLLVKGAGGPAAAAAAAAADAGGGSKAASSASAAAPVPSGPRLVPRSIEMVGTTALPGVQGRNGDGEARPVLPSDHFGLLLTLDVHGP